EVLSRRERVSPSERLVNVERRFGVGGGTERLSDASCLRRLWTCLNGFGFRPFLNVCTCLTRFSRFTCPSACTCLGTCLTARICLTRVSASSPIPRGAAYAFGPPRREARKAVG